MFALPVDDMKRLFDSKGLVFRMHNWKSVLMPAIIVLLLALYVFFASGCNRQIIDTTWKFTYACVYLGEDQYIFGKVDSWKDFENSDMIQVKIEGVTYFTHSSNVILSDE